MSTRYSFTIPLLLFLGIVLLAGQITAADKLSRAEIIAQEESGIEAAGQQVTGPISRMPSGKGLITNTIPQDSVLLIPDSSDPDGVGMYDPYDGAFLGILITDTDHLTTPQCAIKGPDGNIYLSDQVTDGVFVYDTSGTYLFTFCDGSDGLNNVRGIDFRNDTLFVTSGDDYVAAFDAPHSRLTDFINGGMDPYDIHFLSDGRALVSDITGDAIRLYDASGSFLGEVVDSLDFPEQVTYDDLAPGDYLSAAFLTGNRITDFDIDGTIQQTTIWDYGRGVHRLGNGNLLATSNHSSHSGVYEIEPGTGNIIEQENSGTGFHMIELFTLESGPPPFGRCCYNDNQDCVDTMEADCMSLGGVWDAGLNCTDNPCPSGGGCDYVPGDVNGSDSYNGLDITYGVAFFKGGAGPLCPDCPADDCNSWNYCGDVNGSCSYNGLDITYGVAYFKGGASPIYCPDCPPNP